MDTERIAYLYIIQDGNDKDTNIYKVGKSTQKCNTCDTRVIRRMKEYNEGTLIFSIEHVNIENVTKMENIIINTLGMKYKCARGREWFKGNLLEIKGDFTDILKKHNFGFQINDSDDTNKEKKSNKKIEYKCPRCGFQTNQKNMMRRHLFLLKKQCPGIFQDIELTHEMKDYILANRLLHRNI